MADQKPKTRKPKQKPPGWEHWSETRKALYRGIAFAKRARQLLRNAASNMDDAGVIAVAPGNLSREESQDLDRFVAECRVLYRTLCAASGMVEEVAKVPLSDESLSGPKIA